VLAGVGIGVLALALAVPYYANENTILGGSQTIDLSTNNNSSNSTHEGMAFFMSRVTIITLCLLVVVARIMIPLSAIWRARDPFRAAEPGAGRILVVI
jgi:hypothetical protein